MFSTDSAMEPCTLGFCRQGFCDSLGTGPGWEAGKGQVHTGFFSGLLKSSLAWPERQVGRRNPGTTVREVGVSTED